ncbi:MAG: hypothetical protein K1X74_13635 [Pirellulales bacterium]|nr:hypothetical protein [Pirellulales bacterium]
MQKTRHTTEQIIEKLRHAAAGLLCAGKVPIVRTRRSLPVVLLACVVAGCGVKVPDALQLRSFHQKMRWRAEEYFRDPQVVALCRAIERRDLEEMSRLVAAGAEVNARGQGGMTPLLWAYPDNQLPRFERLLELGADPNLIWTSDFDTRGVIPPGAAVTHLVCETSFPGYFDAVFRHGGNPNLAKESPGVGRGDTPLYCAIRSVRSDNVKKLIALGADVNHAGFDGLNPAYCAFLRSGSASVTLPLLEAGAAFDITNGKPPVRIVHMVVMSEMRQTVRQGPEAADFELLKQWLEAHGESLEEARIEVEAWRLRKDSGHR